MKAKIVDGYQKLSQRERYIVAGVGAVAALFLLVTIASSIIPIFTEQAKTIAALEKDVEKLPLLMSRYRQLQLNLEKIESQFNSPRGNDDVLSYLENLFKSAGITQAPNIKKLQPREFGGQFEQTPFTVQFSTTNLTQIVTLLEKIVKGKRPLLLTDLQIDKTRAALQVNFGLSSITRVN